MRPRLAKRRLIANFLFFALIAATAALFFDGPPRYRWINALFLGGVPLLLWAVITLLDKMDVFHIWVAIGRHVRRQNNQVIRRGDEDAIRAEEQREEQNKKHRRIAQESLLVGGGAVLIACILSFLIK